jgi:hypothetical protein
MGKEFEEFFKSDFTLQIFSENKIIFQSKKKGVSGLVDFIGKYGRENKEIVIFDKVVGNAAALLFAFLEAKEVFSQIGSQSAEKTLKEFKIKYHFKKTIVNILDKDESDLCPFEKLSLGKSPEEFYECLNGIGKK